jgi:hypothetical protein
MVPENKQNRRYKQINYIGLQNNHLQVPDQGSTVDFFLFPHLKSIMKGAHFADVVAIQECVTAVLLSSLKEAFADSFRTLY